MLHRDLVLKVLQSPSELIHPRSFRPNPLTVTFHVTKNCLWGKLSFWTCTTLICKPGAHSTCGVYDTVLYCTVQSLLLTRLSVTLQILSFESWQCIHALTTTCKSCLRYPLVAVLRTSNTQPVHSWLYIHRQQVLIEAITVSHSCIHGFKYHFCNLLAMSACSKLLIASDLLNNLCRSLCNRITQFLLLMPHLSKYRLPNSIPKIVTVGLIWQTPSSPLLFFSDLSFLLVADEQSSNPTLQLILSSS